MRIETGREPLSAKLGEKIIKRFLVDPGWLFANDNKREPKLRDGREYTRENYYDLLGVESDGAEDLARGFSLAIIDAVHALLKSREEETLGRWWAAVERFRSEVVDICPILEQRHWELSQEQYGAVIKLQKDLENQLRPDMPVPKPTKPKKAKRSPRKKGKS